VRDLVVERFSSTEAREEQVQYTIQLKQSRIARSSQVAIAALPPPQPKVPAPAVAASVQAEVDTGTGSTSTSTAKGLYNSGRSFVAGTGG
jgi:hypothetical protein